jgi:cyclophilin family peptidyl-prolyl cis-trans isomerase
MRQEILQVQEWGRLNPDKVTNPPAPADQTVTFVTDRGNVVLRLYSERSPASSAALLSFAESLAGSYIAKAVEDQWISLGLQQDAAPYEVETDVEGFPPFETNDLYHFRGSVSFGQRPFSTAGSKFGELKVQLADNWAEDGRSTVIAEVAEGLEILDAVAREQKLEERPDQLASPIEIQEVHVESGAEDSGGEEPGDGPEDSPAAGDEGAENPDGDGS